jgi:hypothetical protein
MRRLSDIARQQEVITVIHDVWWFFRSPKR